MQLRRRSGRLRTSPRSASCSGGGPDDLEEAEQTGVGERGADERSATARARPAPGPPLEIPAGGEQEERQQPAEAAEPGSDGSDPPLGQGALTLEDEGDERD